MTIPLVLELVGVPHMIRLVPVRHTARLKKVPMIKAGAIKMYHRPMKMTALTARRKSPRQATNSSAK